MTKKEYEEYQHRVDANLEGLEYVSTGKSSECEECLELGESESIEFSWTSCDACNSKLGGERYPAHGKTKDGELVHLDVCSDCLYFLNYKCPESRLMKFKSQSKA